MPELPDVELLKRCVDATSLHKAIEHTRVLDESLLAGSTRQKVAASLAGAELESAQRHGKLLGIRSTGDEWLVLHFGMTGDLKAQHGGDPPAHAALLLEFEDGSHLAYTSQRRFGQIAVADDFQQLIKDQKLGPDAMVIDLGEFRELARDRRGGVKSLLMNQQVLAGVGNVYADETLFHAGIRPDRDIDDLADREISGLHRALRHVLRTAIDRHAQPDQMPPSWLLPRRQKDAACPKCGSAIRRSTISGRSTYWCPECQQ